MTYTHVLTAIGAVEEAEKLLHRAQELAQHAGARLSALHVVQPLPPLPGLGAVAGWSPGGDELAMLNQLNADDRLAETARAQLEAACTRCGVAPQDLQVRVGAHGAEILAAAADAGADLIVVGHRRHRGWSALFSHTEESVVHGARCDVLAVALD